MPRVSEAVAKSWTVAALLDWTRGHFDRSGVESPRLCAEILLAAAMGCERIELYTRHDQAPATEILDRFRDHVRRAADGEPIAYLIGHKEFFSQRFEVTSDVLIPRPDTEVLVERVIDLVRRDPALRRIVDIGTGSGCIALSLARHLPEAEISASDISEAALAVARRNAEKLGLAARVDFRAGDLTAPWSDRDFDVLVTNPPYIGLSEKSGLPRNVRDFEPHLALFAGDDGLQTLRRIATEAASLLAPGGHLLCEIAWNQADAVRDLLTAAGWHDMVAYRDAARHERVLHARRPA